MGKNLKGHAAEIISAKLNGGAYLDRKSIVPSIDLFSSTTSILADDADRWPKRAEPAGFSYERLDGLTPDSEGTAWDVSRRLRVLASQQPFDYGPYEHAAHVYRTHGRFSDAESLLIAGKRRARKAAGSAPAVVPSAAHPTRTFRERLVTVLGPTRRVLSRLAAVPPVRVALRLARCSQRRLAGAVDRIYDFTVRYGFRPLRALGFLAAVTIAVSLTLTLPVDAVRSSFRSVGTSGTVYTPDGPAAQPPGSQAGTCRDSDVRCFRPVSYAIETVVPLLDLGQRNVWYVQPAGWRSTLFEIWLTVAALVGWTLSSMFVLSFSRLGRTAAAT